MAWLEQKKSGTFHIVFRVGTDKLRRSLKTKNQKEAVSRRSRIEENLRLIDSGRLTIPDDSDVVSFLLSDGNLNQRIRLPRRIKLGQLYERYTESLPADSMESNSLSTAKTHMNHIAKALGTQLELRSITPVQLQEYINRRTLQPGRFGRTISTTTIKKELSTLRTIWNWAIAHDYVTKPLTLRGLKFPKLDEKAPYRTREEIEREIENGNISPTEQQELWHGLYLRASDISEILKLIEQNSSHGYLYPMAALAAYTGARRSELCRSQHQDIQLVSGKILLREKKRSRSKRTFRQVPIAGSLVPVLTDWFRSRDRGQATFPREWPESRKCEIPEVEGGVVPAEAHHHLQVALRETRWSVIPGWHVFRHSFISNCASRGVDQRMIDDWVGHQTDEQRKRYRHLFPDAQQQEIDRVF